jgi:hypothetical protein
MNTQLTQQLIIVTIMEELQKFLSPYVTIMRLFSLGLISKIAIYAKSGEWKDAPLVVTMENLAELLSADPIAENKKLAFYASSMLATAINADRGPYDVMWACYHAMSGIRHGNDPLIQEMVIGWKDYFSNEELEDLIEAWWQKAPGTFPDSAPES